MNELELQEYLDDERSDIGYAIARCRESNGITQMELSEKTGISLKTLSRIENGNTNYTIENLLRVLEANDLKLIVADRSERRAVVRENVYDTLIKFLIALPFVPYIYLYGSLDRIFCDFRDENMIYVCKQFEYLIDRASLILPIQYKLMILNALLSL